MGMFDPENSERNQPEGAVAGRPLVVARGQAAKLLAAGKQVLHPMPQPVQRPVEGAAAPLVDAARDGDADAPSPARGPDGAATVRFIARHALRPQPWPP